MSRVSPARYRALRDADAQRGKLEMTYSDIADQVGVAERAVGSWMRGDMWPQATNQAKLEHAIGWPDGELRRREDRHKLALQVIDGAAHEVSDDILIGRLAQLAIDGGGEDELRAAVEHKDIRVQNRLLLRVLTLLARSDISRPS
jgi:transcriptional regulator with XRE-family HTH domain